MKKSDIIALFDTLRKANPHPKSDLNYQNPFQLLVAVVLSAQATDVGVNKATPALFAAAPDPQSMVLLGEEGIREHIRTIGLFNNKAKHLFALSGKLLEKHNAEVPATRQELEALPGVGHKTASVVLNIAFGEPTLAVDTHVRRVANRLGLVKEKDPEKIEKLLVKKIPPPYLQHAHHWLILLGRYTCTARSPKCTLCAVIQWCPFKQKTTKVST
ncbi:MAG: endonuclease III [Magnetococcales bacterium]|nr:endonuclease III [Magnetococcales bacterium]